jgi:SAM-dependent methyltransferase
VKLSSIVPWGRNLDEYRAMFALSGGDLRGRVLGCGDGPASFNAEATEAGARVVSVDPLYSHTACEIAARIEATFDTVISQARQRADHYVWDQFADPEALGRVRMRAMRRFLEDYATPRRSGRYVAGSVLCLPFADAAFDLALCSHLLFLYSEQLSLDAHIVGLGELLRVAGEVRLFPLLSLADEPSPHVAPACEAFRRAGYMVEQIRVPYEFQRGANTMLRLRRGAIASTQSDGQDQRRSHA